MSKTIESMSDKEIAQLAITLIDNTSLNLEAETEDSIKALCQKSIVSEPHTAAVCVYPKWIKLCVEQLKETKVQVATVVNFPSGEEPLDKVVSDTKQAVADGVQEVDLVINYKSIIANKDEGMKEAEELCKAVKAACGTACLKVIIEAGALETEELITAACVACIRGGSDMMKTSTGKSTLCSVEQGRFMVKAVSNSDRAKEVGFKAAGGIKTIADARAFLSMGEAVMGREFLVPSKFRIGASSLLSLAREA